MKLFKKIRAYFRYENAVRQAEEAHAKTGDRYYVLPSGNGRLMVIDRQNIRILKKKHYIKQSKTMMDVKLGAIYMTPYRNGTGVMTKEEKKFRRDKYFSLVI